MVGWGNPVRINGWPPDGRWYGNMPQVVLDVCAARRPTALIPKIEAAVEDLQLCQRRRLSALAGAEQQHLRRDRAARRARSSASRCRRTRSAATTAPSLYAGLTDSGTGVEASLWGVLGVKLGWVEGVEVNLLGLVAGLDLRNPGVKLPGFGRIGAAARRLATAPGDA